MFFPILFLEVENDIIQGSRFPLTAALQPCSFCLKMCETLLAKCAFLIQRMSHFEQVVGLAGGSELEGNYEKMGF